MRTIEQVKHEFTPQGKLDPGAQQRLLNTEVAFRDLGIMVLEQVPETPSRTIALNHLLMAKMMCSQAISHPGLVQNQQANTAKESDNGKGKKVS